LKTETQDAVAVADDPGCQLAWRVMGVQVVDRRTASPRQVASGRYPAMSTLELTLESDDPVDGLRSKLRSGIESTQSTLRAVAAGMKESPAYRKWVKLWADLKAAKEGAKSAADRAEALKAQIASALREGEDPRPLEGEIRQARTDQEVFETRAAALVSIVDEAKRSAAEVIRKAVDAKRAEILKAGVQRRDRLYAEFSDMINERLAPILEAKALAGIAIVPTEADVYYGRATDVVSELLKEAPDAEDG
jgi:hypothetical protein